MVNITGLTLWQITVFSSTKTQISTCRLELIRPSKISRFKTYTTISSIFSTKISICKPRRIHSKNWWINKICKIIKILCYWNSNRMNCNSSCICSQIRLRCSNNWYGSSRCSSSSNWWCKRSCRLRSVLCRCLKVDPISWKKRPSLRVVRYRVQWALLSKMSNLQASRRRLIPCWRVQHLMLLMRNWRIPRKRYLLVPKITK